MSSFETEAKVGEFSGTWANIIDLTDHEPKPVTFVCHDTRDD